MNKTSIRSWPWPSIFQKMAIVILIICGSWFIISIKTFTKKTFARLTTKSSSSDDQSHTSLNEAEIWYRQGVQKIGTTVQGTNFTEGIALLQKASDHGHIQAKAQLGAWLVKGFGNPPNIPAGLKLLSEAVSANVPEAQFLLGEINEQGRLVPTNTGTAFMLYRAAAIKEIVGAQYKLALMYRDGRGVAQDDQMAAIWISRAASNGLASAQREFGAMFFNGRGVLEDKALGLFWYARAATGGDPEASYVIGNMYDTGIQLPLDKIEAMRWFRLAATKGSASAQHRLSMEYQAGKTLQPDSSKAAMWLSSAATNGDRNAQYTLGKKYSRGEGVSRDVPKAFELLQKAANDGDPRSMFQLGTMYNAHGTAAFNMVEAIRWYARAATLNYEPAYESLADLAENRPLDEADARRVAGADLQKWIDAANLIRRARQTFPCYTPTDVLMACGKMEWINNIRDFQFVLPTNLLRYAATGGKNDPDKARELSAKARDLAPDLPACWYIMAMAALYKDDVETSLAIARDAEIHFARRPDITQWVGILRNTIAAKPPANNQVSKRVRIDNKTHTTTAVYGPNLRNGTPRPRKQADLLAEETVIQLWKHLQKGDYDEAMKCYSDRFFIRHDRDTWREQLKTIGTSHGPIVSWELISYYSIGTESAQLRFELKYADIITDHSVFCGLETNGLFLIINHNSH